MKEVLEFTLLPCLIGSVDATNIFTERKMIFHLYEGNKQGIKTQVSCCDKNNQRHGGLMKIQGQYQCTKYLQQVAAHFVFIF